MKRPALIEVLLDANRGQYIPQHFAEMAGWYGMTSEDIDALMDGPGHEGYWDAWHNVLRDAYCESDGRTYRLHQDGDLFAYRDAEDEQEAERLREFFGEE